MTDQAALILILVVAVIAFAVNRFPVGIVSLGVMISLWATGIISLDDAFGGFGSPTVILIASLFVVAEGLNAAGITTWMGQLITRHAGDSRAGLLTIMMVVVAILTAVITPNGSVAAVYPLVVVLAVRFGYPPSKLLMPTAFAAHAGALLVLTGSPVTLLVADTADHEGLGRLGFFEVSLVGLPLLIGTILVVILAGDRLLPNRQPRSLVRDMAEIPGTLHGHYLADDEFLRFNIDGGSPLVGQLASNLRGDGQGNLAIVSVKNADNELRTSSAVAAGDRITLRGDHESVLRFAVANRLGYPVSGGEGAPERGLVTRDYGVAEVVISPRSAYIGDEVFPGMVTDSGQLVVLAVDRPGVDLGTAPVTLQAGDSLLLEGRWAVLDEQLADTNNVIVVDSPDAIKRQTIALGAKAPIALGLLAAMVVLLVGGWVPSAIATLACAIGMVLLGVVTVEQAHRSMNWTTIIMVGAMIPLSTAITDTGLAERISDAVLGTLGDFGWFVLLTALFLITAVFGQIISNTATALILIPITITIAYDAGYSPMTLLMCLNVAAAAALLTPIATPANLMVMEPAGYKFGDYWKLGVAILAVYYIVAVVLVPVIWPLH
ncbi:MAG: SLC13 family permease [Thermomicrobiales bacterium]|nr:SLC13 family permease [Thermomicrobiales bacterium]